MEYYPRRVVTFKDLRRSFPMLQFRDVDEEQRVRDVAAYGTLPLHPASHCVKYAYKEEEEEEAKISRM